MSSKHEHSQALAEMWEIALKYRWRFILPAFLVTSAVLAVSFFLPRKYQADATFERRTNVVLSEIAQRGAVDSFADPSNTFLEEVAGRPAIDDFIERNRDELTAKGFIKTALDEQRLRSNMIRYLVVERVVSSGQLDRIRVNYVSWNPELAAVVANGLVTSYIERTDEAMISRLKESAHFFREELGRHRAIYEDLENRILAFEVNNAELLPDHPRSIQAQIAETQEELASLLSDRALAMKRLQALRDSHAAEPETLPAVVRGKNPAIVELQKELEGLLTDESKMVNVMKMRDKHPDLVTVRALIEAKRAEIAGTDAEVVMQTNHVRNAKRSEIELRMTTAASDLAAFDDRIESVRAELEAKAAKASELLPTRASYSKLTRELNEVQRQISFWEDNLRRCEMSMAAESGNRGIDLTFIKPARAVAKPVSPHLAQVVMAAIGLGLLAGTLCVFIAHRTDESFSSGEQLTGHFDLPLFGCVSELVSRRHQRIRRIRNMIMYPINAAVMLGVLATLVALLYMDLERPESLAQVRPVDKTQQAAQVEPKLPEPITQSSDATK